MVKKVPDYWTKEVELTSNNAKDFKELSVIGINILKNLPNKTILVCGPISTGGLGSIEANLYKLNATVHKFIKNGESVFDQTPFEDVVIKLRKKLNDINGQKTLNDFYLPLFKSGYIKEVRFLPDWKSSKGATWEHNLAKKLGIKITYITNF